MAEAESFAAFLARFRAATDRFYAGEPGPYKALHSHADDAVRFGGWGGVERGWAELGARYDTTNAHFAGGRLDYEPLATHEADGLACTVGIERGEIRLADGGVEHLASRVTHVYRREGGEWKLVHRHADPLVETRRE